MIDKDEKILCAAIWVKTDEYYPHQPNNISSGFVVCGFRHCNILGTLTALNHPHNKDQRIQGFLTTKNRFVNRRMARAIAVYQKQCIKEPKFDELFSEDLY